ncbi:MAG: DEAD/DEAH box helicase [Verrucomicrobia bacterium]|nr:DEAD/DEAH box helicase [Kiritimatiellia bacterium]MCO6401648.1 DEAD/DEAH box helicase [Verrucomicrobiota bacterium]
MVKKLIQKVIRQLRGNAASKSAAKSPAKPEFKTDPVARSKSQHHAEYKPRRKSAASDKPIKPAAKPAPLAPEPQAAPATPWDPASFQVPAAEGKLRFHDLNLPNEVLHGIADLEFSYCTPIQAGILPETLKGRDALGQGQTGTGKTAAFLLTIFDRILRNPNTKPRKPGHPRALILAPTRELCIQIHKDATKLGAYTGINTIAVFGGMDYEKQKTQLHTQRVDIITATPGRLIDFKRRGDLNLRDVEILVLDEADRMLDMGFIPDVRTIVHATPHKDKRQTLFFSATFSDDIRRLATSWTRDPASVIIEPESVAVDTVEQVVYIVTADKKFALLHNILHRENARRVICFVNRRDNAERLLDRLRLYGVNCALLSGAVPQEKRVKTLERFRSGEIHVMVATDVAGRGIHVDDITHVVNYNLPDDPEDYVHRIGRTGRAGHSGISISFADEEDSFYIPDIEEFIGRPLVCTHPEDAWLELPAPPEGAAREHARSSSRRHGGDRNRGPRSSGPRNGGGQRGPRRDGRRSGGHSHRPRTFDGSTQHPPAPPKAPDLPA